MELTKSQKEAVTYSGRNLQLIACAGSGKTEVVAQRVAHLLTKKGKGRLEPRNIVAFTFTEKAAAELKDRIVRRTQEAVGGEMTGMAEMYVGTIHGFCQELLQVELSEYKKYEVLDAVRQGLFVNRHSAISGLTTTQDHDGNHLKRWRDTSLYTSALSILREEQVPHENIADTPILEGLLKYNSCLRDAGYFDFTALLDLAVHELTHNLNLQQELSRRVKCLIVDEYQDVNPIQEQIIRILHSLGAGVCVVGDDDQTIYQWRGSSVSHIQRFSLNYKPVKQIRLEENFRSSQGIIETARDFVSAVGDRLPKEMKYAKAQHSQTGDVVALSFGSPAEEAAYIVDTIHALTGTAFKEGGNERGLSWSDMAILLRSVRTSGGPITSALKAAGIHFVVKGMANLFDTAEAQATRILFHYLADQTTTQFNGWSGIEEIAVPTNPELRRAWEDAELGLTKANLNKALRYATRVRDNLQQEGSRAPTIQKVFLDFLELSEVREELVPNKRGQVALFNLGRFSQVISDWETINFRSQPLSSFQLFVSFLYNQARFAYSEGEEDNDYVTPNAVQVMTIHQAKGREWPVVFLPALEKGRFPSNPRPSGIWRVIPKEVINDSERYDGSLDDERRLFYVALTRGKKFLHMTCGHSPIGRGGRSPSDFWNTVTQSEWVQQRRPNYSRRKHLDPQPKDSVANVEFSFSNLKYLLDCGYQFKLRVLYGFNGPLAEPLGYGKSLHDALAEVHDRAMQGEQVNVDLAPELVARHLRIPFAPPNLVELLEAKAIHEVKQYINKNARMFKHVIFSEQPVEINMENGIAIKGRIDLIRRTDTGTTTIVDMKSSERSQDEDVTQAQLHAYALGYRELTGEDADFVETYELEKGRRSAKKVSDSLIGDILTKTQEGAAALRSMQLHPNPQKQKCKRCDFSMLCSASMA